MRSRRHGPGFLLGREPGRAARRWVSVLARRSPRRWRSPVFTARGGPVAHLRTRRGRSRPLLGRQPLGPIGHWRPRRSHRAGLGRECVALHTDRLGMEPHLCADSIGADSLLGTEFGGSARRRRAPRQARAGSRRRRCGFSGIGGRKWPLLRVEGRAGLLLGRQPAWTTRQRYPPGRDASGACRRIAPGRLGRGRCIAHLCAHDDGGGLLLGPEHPRAVG